MQITMNGSFCAVILLYAFSNSDLKELRTTFIANCVFNNFLSYTAIMLNIVTMYAIRRTSSLPKTLKTLLLSLAFSDVGVGLFVQPLYIFSLVKWLKLDRPSCNTYQVWNISSNLFSAASFLGVVAVSVDRVLAVHLHLRYQELVTQKRAVTVVISIWVFSAFISLLVLWSSSATQNLVLLVIAATGFIVSFVVCTRIYLTVRRHKKQIQSMQIQEIFQAREKANFTALIKSTVGLFYVYLVFLISYLPFFICIAVVRIYGSSIAFRKVFIFSWTLIFLNSSLNPVIYCWKMRHIRRVIIEILGNLSWSRSKPFRLHYNRSSRVVHVEN